MQKYVALLRGINVGGNKKVEMKKLKEVFESIGYKNVSTYINSGNVIFERKKGKPSFLAKEIEKVLENFFGFPIKALVREAENINKLQKEIPRGWSNDAKIKTDVLFLWEEFDKKDSLRLIVSHPEVDRLKYIQGAIVWSVDRKNYDKSGMKKFIGTKLYKNMTARNVNTVRKLVDLIAK